MALERLITVKVDSSDAQKNFNALERKMKSIDVAVKKMGASVSSMAGDLAHSASASDKQISALNGRIKKLNDAQKESSQTTQQNTSSTQANTQSKQRQIRLLENMVGAVSNVERATLSHNSALTKQDQQLLKLDTSIRQANKRLEEGRYSQEVNKAAIESATQSYQRNIKAIQQKTKATAQSRLTLMDMEGALENQDRLIQQVAGRQSQAERVTYEYDTMLRRLNRSFGQGRVEQGEYMSSMRRLEEWYGSAHAAAVKMDNETLRGRSIFRAMRGATSQFSYQLQDIAVQTQMGTDAMIILAQQGPQIASIFGPAGAVIGAFIAVGATLGTMGVSLFDTSSALDKMLESAEDVEGVFDRAGSGVQSFSSELVELYRINESLANLDLTISLLELDETLSMISSSTDDIFDDMGALWGFLGGVDTRTATKAFADLQEAGVDLADFFNEGGEFSSWKLLQDGSYQANAFKAQILEAGSAVNNLVDELSLSGSSAQGLLGLMTQVRQGGGSDADFSGQLTNIKEYIGLLDQSGQITDDNRKKIIDVMTSLFQLVKTEQEAFERRNNLSEDLLEQYRSINSIVDEGTAYIASMTGELNDSLSVVSTLSGIEQEINDRLTERLQTMQVIGDKEEAAAQARAQAESALTQLRTNALAEYLVGLDRQSDREQAINDIRSKGVSLSAEMVKQANALANEQIAEGYWDTFGEADEELSRLITTLGVWSKKLSENESDTRLQNRIANIKDEIIELGQSGDYISNTTDRMNELFSAGIGNDTVQQRLKSMREQGKLTADQFKDLSKSYQDQADSIGDAQAKSLKSLNEEIAAYEKGEKAVQEYADRQQALQALQMQDVNFDILSKEDKEAAEARIEEIIERIKYLRDLKVDPFSEMLGNIESGVSSMQDLAEITGSGAKEMEVAMAAVNLAQATYAVLNQAGGDPYTAFARMAAMATAVAQLGASVGNLSGNANISADRQASQGTGTVLGDLNAKSESISNAVEYSADALEDLVGINSGMLDELRNLNNAISDTSNIIARDVSYSGIAGNLGLTSTAKMASTLGNPLSAITGFGALTGGALSATLGGGSILSGMGGGAVGALTGGLSLATGGLAAGMFAADKLLLGGAVTDIFSGIANSIAGALFGKSSVSDEGINILGGTIAEIISEDTVQAYQTVKTKSLFSSKTRNQFGAVSEAVESQFDLMFASIFDAVAASALSLGYQYSEIEQQLNNFVVEAQMISLRDLSPEDQAAELNAVFSRVFDQLATSVVPLMKEFQKAGEGMGETLARVSTNFQVANEAIRQLDLVALSGTTDNMIRASEAFIGMFDDASDAASSFTGFVDTFATDERKLEILTEGLTTALGEQDVAILNSRDSVYGYISALDISNEAEAKRLANILGLTDSLDDYFSLLEDVNNAQEEALADYTSLQIQLATAQGNTDLATRLTREQELAGAVDDTARSYLKAIYAAEDLSLKNDEIASAQYRLNEALGFDDVNKRIDRQKELASATSDTTKIYLSAIYALEDAQSSLESTMDSLNQISTLQQEQTDLALSALERSINAQIEAITEDYSQRIEDANEAVSDLSDTVSGLESLIGTLESAISSASITSGAIELAQIRSARNQIASILASGEIPVDGSIDGIIGLAATNSANYYATFEDYVKEQSKSNNNLKKLKENAEDQLTDAEKLQKVNEDQLEALQDGMDDQIDALEDQLQLARDQLDTLRGIDVSISDLKTALTRFYSALSTEEQGTSAYTAEEIKAEIDAIYKKHSNNGVVDWDAADTEILLKAAQYGVSYAEIAQALGKTEEKVTSRANDIIGSASPTATSISRSSSGYSASTITEEIDRIYAANSNNANASDFQIGLTAIANGVSSAELADATGLSQAEILARAEELGLPAFESGGMHSGGYMIAGENDAELIATGAARVFNAGETRNILSGGTDNSDYILGRIFDMLRELNVKMIESNKNTKNLSRWEKIGLPPERA